MRAARFRVGACLSLTGGFARFGRQAAAGLAAWRRLQGDGWPEPVIEDDGSDPASVPACLGRLGAACDLVLGPYSGLLMRAAVRGLPDVVGVLWNHGGAPSDVQTALARRVVSVLTPARRYAEPYVAWLARQPRARLAVLHGRGPFAREVAAGAADAAGAAGLEARLFAPADWAALATAGSGADWDLFCVGSFEHDVEAVRWARALDCPPRTICAVAAGTREFAAAAGTAAHGTLGIAQWLPGVAERGAVTALSTTQGPLEEGDGPDVGPREEAFIAAYRDLTGTLPDYPAAQACAAAALAVHCAECGGLAPADLWATVRGLRARTFYGAFAIDPETGMQRGHTTLLTRHGAGDQERV